MAALTPRDASDVEAAVRDAIGAGQPLEVVGHGTKRAIGHRAATNALLDMSGLAGVTSYEPNELILTVQAGAGIVEGSQPAAEYEECVNKARAALTAIAAAKDGLG